MLDARSAVLARLILALNLNPLPLAACRRGEEGAWWEVLRGAISQ